MVVPPSIAILHFARGLIALPRDLFRLRLRIDTPRRKIQSWQTEMTRTEGAEDEVRIRFRERISRLRYARGEFATNPIAGFSGDEEQVHPGFLVHSILGKGLRQTACINRPKCRGTCAASETCAYGRLFEPRPAKGTSPLASQRRATAPCLVRAPWTATTNAPLRFAIILLGRHEEQASPVTTAIEAGFSEGVGRRRIPHRLQRATWSHHTISTASSSLVYLRLELETPVRILRKKKERRRLLLDDLVRDILFRTAAWGHHHQGLPWLAPPPFLATDTTAATVALTEERFVTFARYSGRQRRVIRLGGLLGTLSLRNVSPELGLLLRAGLVCGVGKGGSIGLGSIKIGEPSGRSGESPSAASRSE